DRVARPDRRAIDHAVRMNFGVSFDAAVAKVIVRSDADAVSELDFADEDGVHVDDDIATDSHFTADVDARGIDDRRTGQHQFSCALQPQSSFELRELNFVVDAEYFGLGGRNHRPDLQSFANGHDDDVRQVVL